VTGVAEILKRASALGIRLSAERGVIAARPKGATPSDLADAIKANRDALLAHLRARAQGPDERQNDCSPAKSLIDTCRKYGVGLRLDEGGDAIVLENYDAERWPSLLMAITAHAQEIAALLVMTSDGERLTLRRVEA
jgi:hypothetical protein